MVDVGHLSGFDFKGAFESKLFGGDLLRPEAHSFGDVLGRDGDLVSGFVDASNDDVGVGIVGVVVVDGSPFECASEIFFDLPHQFFGEVGEVKFMCIFG